MIMLLPERRTGVYIAYNRKAPPQPGREFRQAFMARYYPQDARPRPQPHPAAATLARNFAGAYRESRWSHTLADKLVYTFTRYYQMEATPDGHLQFHEVTYVATEPNVFQAVDAEGTLIFHCASACYGFYDYDPHKVFIKLAWYETRSFHLGLLLGCVALFASAVIAGPLGRAPAHAPWIAAEAHGIFRWISVFNLLYPVGMLGIGITGLIDALPDLSFLAPLFIMGLIGGLLVELLMVGLAWRGRYWSAAQRVHYTLVALSGCVFAGWLNYWNLLRLWQF
jgi:hypothetical protein